MFLDGKSSKEYPVNARAAQGSILGRSSYYVLMTSLTMLSVIMLSMILLSILSVIWHLICGNNSELESDLRDTIDCGKKWLADFNARKTQLVSFDQANNNGSIDVKMDGSVREEKSSFKMLGLTFPFKLDWGSYIIYTAKTASKKTGALICSMFLSP